MKTYQIYKRNNYKFNFNLKNKQTMEELKNIDENNIIYDGVKYKAVNSYSTCKGCAFEFYGLECMKITHCLCLNGSRKDRRSVIWVKDEFVQESYDDAIRKAKENLIEKAKPLL